jgi:hypothetical protein
VLTVHETVKVDANEAVFEVLLRLASEERRFLVTKVRGLPENESIATPDKKVPTIKFPEVIRSLGFRTDTVNVRVWGLADENIPESVRLSPENWQEPGRKGEGIEGQED